MERFEVLNLSDEQRWLEVLDLIGQYDVYHLPSYHQLSEISDKGKGIFLTYTKNDLVVAFPLIIRNINDIPGLNLAGHNWYDAVSVYGYVGPVASRNLSYLEKTSFFGYLQEYFDSASLVSVFSTLNPILRQEDVLEGFGDIVPTRPTLSIDLTLPPEIQWSSYRNSFKREINRLVKKGYKCFEDKEKEYWDKFVCLYNEAMKRVNASSYFFFPEQYFNFMRDKMDNIMRLFVCLYDNEIIYAATASSCQGIIQTHLGGAKDAHIAMGPGKQWINTIRMWGNEKGDHTLHLGRGLGGARDSLLFYKKGFSKKEHPYFFWKLVNNKKVYQELVQNLSSKTGIEPDMSYFPSYRYPAFFE